MPEKAMHTILVLSAEEVPSVIALSAACGVDKTAYETPNRSARYFVGHLKLRCRIMKTDYTKMQIAPVQAS